MCGICGIWDAQGVTAADLHTMNAAVTHRGPDDDGIAVMDCAGLAARRLSVIDVDKGHQPIYNEDHTACIAFNGEIYNYRILRTELEARGHKFRSETDTEVILHLWEQEGDRVVQRLRGMFAFAIWDCRSRRLLLARDRFGQKPLYWAWDGNRFLFGSEIKSILALRQQPASLDMGALDDFLTLRFVPGPNTMFAGINKIPPASLLILDVAAGKTDGRPSVNLRRYWELQFSPKRTLSERAAISETRDMIREAVKIHMVSDVPIGAFLSGGLDSSTVVAMMSEQSVEPISTFAIGVQEEDFNELGFASELAAHCGTNHRQQVVSPNLVQLLPDIVWHMEEPSDPVATCMYHAAALARHHVKVVLTGDGGDEMFAGFDRYWGFEWVRYYAALPATLRRGLLGPLLRRLPDNAAYKNLTQKARWVHELSFHEAGRRYAEATVFFRFGAPDKAGLYTEETLANLYGRDPAACIARAFDSAVAENDLDRMLSADINTRLPQHSLMLTDRMTMAVGLEARAPLLDHRLAEEVATLAASIKAPGGSLKHLLREAAAPYLPQRTLHRPKQGFMFPLALWIKGPLAPVLNHLIENSALVAAGIFRREAMQQLMSEHLANQVDHHARLWMLLNLELWYRIYVLGVSRSYLTLELEELIRRGKR